MKEPIPGVSPTPKLGPLLRAWQHQILARWDRVAVQDGGARWTSGAVELPLREHAAGWLEAAIASVERRERPPGDGAGGRLPEPPEAPDGGLELPPACEPSAVFRGLSRLRRAVAEVLAELHSPPALDAVLLVHEAVDEVVAAVALEMAGRERRAIEAAELRHAELRAQATALLEASVDFEEILQRVARLAVPGFADWCVLDVLREGGAVERVAAAHGDPEKVSLAHEMARRFPPSRGEPGGVARVLCTRSPEVLWDISDAALAASAEDAEHLASLRAMGFRSSIAVPLIARGEPVGVLLFAMSESGRRFQPGDLAVAQDLAGRAALAVHNARMFAQAREAIRIRDEFFSIATHELKTPLATIQLRLDLLRREATRRDALPAADVQAGIEAARRQVERLATLVDNLLDVARIQNRRLDLETEVFDLCAVVQEVSGRLREHARRAGCALSLDLAGPAVGRWDRLRIEQVLTNLLTNAFKYGAGRPVLLTTESDGSIARIKVADEGIGIAEKDHDRIFERFERLASSHRAESLGLGLYIVREIVRAHGGRIAVRSRPGEGATFLVELPLGQADPERPEPPGIQRDNDDLR